MNKRFLKLYRVFNTPDSIRLNLPAKINVPFAGVNSRITMKSHHLHAILSITFIRDALRIGSKQAKIHVLYVENPYEKFHDTINLQRSNNIVLLD